MQQFRPIVVAALAVFLLFSPAGPHAQTATGQPRLLVILVVDQMRQDYLSTAAPFFSRGLKRLLTTGAVFEQNRYPYLNTVTCAGHATIGSGAFPATHGIILNAWWRGTKSASCTDDSTVSAVAYGPDAEAVGHSAAQLAVPSMGDRLRARTPASRVVTLSIKPRSAVMLAGHGGTVTWLDDQNVWASSTAFVPAPAPGVLAFLTANPVSALRDAVWERIHPAAAYRGSDAAVDERAPNGWTPTFPHPLAGAPGTRPRQFETLWETSPYSDAYLGRMAASVVTSMQLGQRDAVDYLGVSFSALDYVGHAFGPDSHEVQDTLARLDGTIGDLLDALDATVGPTGYVVGLSADHGVGRIPEAVRRDGGEAGRLATDTIRKAAEDAFTATLGVGPHVARVEYTQVYLTTATRAKAIAMPEALAAAASAIAALPGVMRAMPSTMVAGQRTSSDPVVRAAALSYFAGRSGDLVVVPKESWMILGANGAGTTHGTLHPYDNHVPLIFMGPAFKAGRYTDPSSPADLAPTLASVIGLPMPGADGHVLAVAKLKPPR